MGVGINSIFQYYSEVDFKRVINFGLLAQRYVSRYYLLLLFLSVGYIWLKEKNDSLLLNGINRVHFLLVFTLSLVTIGFDSLVLFLITKASRENYWAISDVLKSNVYKLFGGGFTQLFMLGRNERGILSDLFGRWTALIQINFFGSIPFTFLLIYRHPELESRNLILAFWIFCILACIYTSPKLLTKFEPYKIVLAAICTCGAQLAASLAISYCLRSHSISDIPIIVFCLLISLVIPIPNGLVVRELALTLFFAQSNNLTEVLIASAIFRVIQILGELCLGTCFYLLDLWKTKKEFQL